jgi:adenosine/AMP kinase
MELEVIKIKKPADMNFILGHSHFIKTVEDIHEAIVNTQPAMKFGVAFCEASQQALVRYTGNDEKLIALAQKNAMNLACGHSFIIFMDNGFPLNILNTIKMVPEVVRIFCATANDTEVVVAKTALGRGIMGVIDGIPVTGIEEQSDIDQRKQFLRQIGYKF